eukprot:bmy_15871T0
MQKSRGQSSISSIATSTSTCTSFYAEFLGGLVCPLSVSARMKSSQLGRDGLKHGGVGEDAGRKPFPDIPVCAKKGFRLLNSHLRTD